MDYKSKLGKTYNEIYSCDSKCSCFAKCSKGMPNGRRINCCKLKLGSKYGCDIPKIMFVGKEGVNPDTEIKQPEKVSNVSNDNTHYFGTIHTLAYILKRISKDDFCNSSIINKSSLSEFDDLSDKFCLTNYFKCAFRNEDDGNHDVKTNTVMKKNCPIILTKEIEILKPNILIMQGKFSTAKFYGKRGTLLGICNYSKDESETLNTICESKCNISIDKYIYNETKEPLYIIWSYHPCAHGSTWFNTLPEFQKSIDVMLEAIYND